MIFSVAEMEPRLANSFVHGQCYETLAITEFQSRNYKKIYKISFFSKFSNFQRNVMSSNIISTYVVSIMIVESSRFLVKNADLGKDGDIA